MSRILLTGFPGFLASALLPRLLEGKPGAEVVCLIQRAWSERAHRALEALEARRPGLDGRVRLVEGDIVRPRLGVIDDTVLEDVEEVFHLAAIYDLGVGREEGLAVNRDGTRNVVEACRETPTLRRLHYVSTCYVSGRHPGTFREDDLDVGQAFNNRYEETKFLAEVEVREAMRDGLPVTVYRPAIVVGDARTGVTQKYDGPYFVLGLLLRQPRFAFLPVPGNPEGHEVNLVPRDWVVEALARLAERPDTVGATYHLADPRPPTVDRLIEILAEATGRRVVRIPVPLRLARWATRHLPGVRTLTGVPAEALDYFVHPTRYATDRTQAALAGFAPPPLPSYAGALARFMEENPEPAPPPAAQPPRSRSSTRSARRE